jgi:hypothetical protein
MVEEEQKYYKHEVRRYINILRVISQYNTFYSRGEDSCDVYLWNHLKARLLAPAAVTYLRQAAEPYVYRFITDRP